MPYGNDLSARIYFFQEVINSILKKYVIRVDEKVMFEWFIMNEHYPEKGNSNLIVVLNII